MVDPPTPWHRRPQFTTDTDIRMVGGGEGRKEGREEGTKAHIKKWGAHADPPPPTAQVKCNHFSTIFSIIISLLSVEGM